MSNNQFFNEMQIGRHVRKNASLNPSGKGETKVVYRRQSGADVIEYQETADVAGGQKLGFNQPGRITVGEGYDIFDATAPDEHINASEDVGAFVTKNGSPPADMHRDDLLFTDKQTGVQMTVMEAQRRGYARKGQYGWEAASGKPGE